MSTWTDHEPGGGAGNVAGPGPPPSPTAPAPSVAPAWARRAVQPAIDTPSPSATISGSPVPTVTGVPDSHGLSEPPSAQVKDPSWPMTGSPPSAASVACGGPAAD